MRLVAQALLDFISLGIATHSPLSRYAVINPPFTKPSRHDSRATEHVSSLQRTNTTIAISSFGKSSVL
jgi:hypothetical protein